MTQAFLPVLRIPALEEIPWVEHGFGTRRSVGWPGEPLTTVKQIHSNKVLLAAGATGFIGEGDALVTATPGTRLGIRTADCLPILIADRTKPVVAAVHAGWRGTVAGISARAVEVLETEFGCRPHDLVFAVGPAIGECCFEVGPEVGREFQALFPERSDLGQRTRIDLIETTRRQLGQLGIARDQIAAVEQCTCCDSAFESYRRDRDASGRMVAMIGIRSSVTALK